MGGLVSFATGWLGRRTATQLAAGIAVLSALALGGSLLVMGGAVRLEQRQTAALAALDDYGEMVEKLGVESEMTHGSVTAADAIYLSNWLEAFQNAPGREGEARSLEETCRTGRGGAGVRYIRGPVGPPAGLAALETVRGARAPGLGADVWLVPLKAGTLCRSRPVEVVVVRRSVGVLEVAVGRVVDRSGAAWARAAAAVVGLGVLLLAGGLGVATYARRRLTGAVAEVSRALDRAAVGDFSVRAPETEAAPELVELSARVNQTLDRLEELLAWLRDSADQLAHDFRTPLARATARLDRLAAKAGTPETRELAAEARSDLDALIRAMNEAMALRDGEAWSFDNVRLDILAARAVELYRPLAEQREIAMDLDVGETTVLGVPSLLQRAVANLVDNAVKFSPDGGRVSVSVGRDDTGPWLAVADEGPGFAGEDVPAEDPSVREARESHGMGLAFVRAILRRHGASMMIDDARPGAVVTARFSR